MNSQTIIPIIIPFYKAQDKLDKCLAAIKQQAYQFYEIFIRDNSDDNILYTAAINEGLRKFAFNDTYQYILVLSQDAYLQDKTLEYLLKLIEADPACGICCPLQLSEATDTVSWGGSLDAFPKGIHVTKALESYQEDFDTYWANGAAMLIRTSMIREIGLLDKNMRFICSDSDYSFTARSRGWKVKASIKSHIHHSPNSSLTTKNLPLEIIKTEDWLYFSNKWLTGNLYKTLSHEGDTLTRMKVSLAIEAFKNQLEQQNRVQLSQT